jgi:hypothetical protein
VCVSSQDAVLTLLLKKQQEERQLLAEMLVNPRFEVVQKEAAVESAQQRSDRLSALKSKRQSSNLGEAKRLLLFIIASYCRGSLCTSVAGRM